MPADGWGGVPIEWSVVRAGSPVLELRRKLALLRTYSPRTNWSLLAAPFGVSPKTLKYRGHGSATRAADQIAPTALPVLLDLFAAVLPDGLDRRSVRQIVFGPVARLEAEIRSVTAPSFATLIAQHGQSGRARLFKKSPESALIEVEGEATPGLPRLRLGDWFRVEFPLQADCRHAAVIQGVQRIWAPVPSVIAGDVSWRVLTPTPDGDRQPRFMRERRDTGLHRFVCLQATEPFPAAIGERLRESVAFDKQVLDDLAGFYARLPAAQRACHVLTLAIEPEATS